MMISDACVCRCCEFCDEGGWTICIVGYMCVKLNYLKLVRADISMDLLFTFNSEQFQVVRQPPSNSQSIRKRIISNLKNTRQVSVRSDSSTYQQLQFKKTVKSDFKKVDFDLTPLPELKKHHSEAHNFLEENLQKIQKMQSVLQTRSRRYLGELQNKKSLQLERKSSLAQKNLHENENSSVEAETSLRRQRRIKSLRLAPKLIIPLSDRKLPKVFKMLQGENYQPMAFNQKQEKKRLIQSRQMRETLSSHRARVLLNFSDQVLKLSKRQCLDELFPPRI